MGLNLYTIQKSTKKHMLDQLMQLCGIPADIEPYLLYKFRSWVHVFLFCTRADKCMNDQLISSISASKPVSFVDLTLTAISRDAICTDIRPNVSEDSRPFPWCNVGEKNRTLCRMLASNSAS